MKAFARLRAARSCDPEKKATERSPSPKNQSAPSSLKDVRRVSHGKESKAVQYFWFLRRPDQMVVATLVVLVLCFMAFYQLKVSGWGREPIEIRHFGERIWDSRVNINSAGWLELVQLPQVGPVTAKRIVTDRIKEGPFTTIEDLQRVRGIGPKTVIRLRELVRIE